MRRNEKEGFRDEPKYGITADRKRAGHPGSRAFQNRKWQPEEITSTLSTSIVF
jgi:hypothetical protein